jgi:hypothetical protein
MLLHAIRGVLREAAMADGASSGGGDDGSQPQARGQGAEKPSVHERLKAFLSAPQERDQTDAADDAEGEVPAQKQTKEPPKAQKAQQQAAAEGDDDGSPDGEDSPASDVDFTTVAELADRTGLSLDRLLDLSVPARIDGKESKATIRELVKSFQLDGHLTNKLQTHASEVQAWKTQQAQERQAYQQQMQKLDAGLQVAQRALQGEFNSVNWDALQQSDPAQFAQTLLGFQQRQAMLSQLADQLGGERRAQEQQQAEAHKAYLTEQKQLLESKLPEWADQYTRESTIKEMVDVVGKAYGITAEDIGRLTDHRDILVLNDALKWQKLQASKAPVLNKVRQAPKLLKPGTTQSQAARQGIALTEAKSKLRKSGSVRDAASALRSLGIV